MRLPGIRTEKSHSFYLIIYQVFKSIFSIENETLRLFLQKNFLRKRKLLPFQGDRLASSLPRVLPWAKSFCPFRACGAYI